MVVGYLLLGWLTGLVAAVAAAFRFDVSWLAALGIFSATGTVTATLAILWVAWRTGCFSPPPQREPALPSLAGSGPPS